MAAKTDLPNLTPEEAEAALRKLMEEGPLYQKLTYSGAIPRRYPDALRLDCKGCDGPQNWQRARPVEWPDSAKWAFSGEPTDRGAHGLVLYICRNCGKRQARFAMTWIEVGGANHITKFGQQPSLEDRIPGVLEKRVDEQDRDLLVKALRCRNFGYGLGALAYLRRVLENRVNDLIDSVAEEAKKSSGSVEALSKVAEVKGSWQFDRKVKFATDLVPDRLKPDGRNPLDALHDLASKGIHHHREEECIAAFDRCRAVLEYVLGELQVEHERTKQFVEGLRDLDKPKGPK